jgi:NADH dehydrogenase
MQQGRYAGRLIGDRLAGRSTRPFRYRDKGSLATIGRARAVAELPPGLRLSGVVAWATWLLVHIYYLIGFENRLVVLVRWAYNFLTHGRGARVITEATE